MALLAGGIDVALAQFAGSPPGTLGAGFRVGPSKGVTELDDQDEFLIHGFLQKALRPGWQGELGLGYGQLTNSRYTTDMLMAEARLLYTLMTFREWYGYLYGGVGLIDYDITAAQNVAEPDFQTLGLTRTAMTGAGFQVGLSRKLTLEVSGGYTHSFSDQLNGTETENGNDAFWSWSLGIRIEERPRSTVPWVPPQPAPQPVMAEAPLEPVPPAASVQEETPRMDETVEVEPPPVVVDADGDQLEDAEERAVYFTNPMMADSDGDGLGDGEEVLQYGTSPNQADSDGGGVDDGVEVERGTDPWSQSDDGVPETLAAASASIFFTTNSARLDLVATDSLTDAARALIHEPELHLELRGFTDDVGNREKNLALALARARAVRQFLVDLGIDGRRLKVVAVGEKPPLASNQTEEGRQANRRVDLVPLRPSPGP